MYRAVGQTQPQYASTTYKVTLPIVGTQDITIPTEKLAVDMLNAVYKYAPGYVNALAPQVVPGLVGQAYSSARPFLDQELINVKEHAKTFVANEVDPKLNRALIAAGVLSVTTLGALAYVMMKGRK